MVQRDSDLDAAVFEDQHVLDVRARPQFGVALAPYPHQRSGTLGRERRERAVVAVGVDDDLGGAARRLERGEAILEDRDLEGLEGDLGLGSSRPCGA